MQYMTIQKLIKGYIGTYLNPRINQEFRFSNWVFKKDTEHDGSELIISYYLYFINKSNKYITSSELSKTVFNELIKLDKGNEFSEYFYDLINSFLIAFYLPLVEDTDRKLFAYHKAVAFFQLLLNSDAKKNDFIRDKYIKYFFKHSYMSDYISFIDYKNGILIFEGKEMKSLFLNLLKRDTSFIFNEVIKYCLSFIDFLENGFSREELDLFIHDIYSEQAHYCYYLMMDKKPYRFKKIVTNINEAYQYPKLSNINFINYMMLLNFVLLERNAESYIEKYISNSNVLNNISSDITLIQNSYIK